MAPSRHHGDWAEASKTLNVCLWLLLEENKNIKYGWCICNPHERLQIPWPLSVSRLCYKLIFQRCPTFIELTITIIPIKKRLGKPFFDNQIAIEINAKDSYAFYYSRIEILLIDACLTHLLTLQGSLYVLQKILKTMQSKIIYNWSEMNVVERGRVNLTCDYKASSRGF